jgi:hypothetical protein
MRLLIALLLFASFSTAATEPRESRYHWEATAIGNTADLLTLFCRETNYDIPLVAVLRDTLGDSDPENDRVSYMWLLPYTGPSVIQNLLSAVPFSGGILAKTHASAFVILC